MSTLTASLPCTVTKVNPAAAISTPKMIVAAEATARAASPARPGVQATPARSAAQTTVATPARCRPTNRVST
jgi:hypothetical protein